MRIMQAPVYIRLSKPKRYLAWASCGGIILTFYFLFSRFISPDDDVTSEPFTNDALKTPRKYTSKNLYEWTKVVPVPHVPGLPGELGKPVVLHSKEDEEAKKRFKEHEFNIVVSEMMSVNRSLADMRHPQCLTIKYPPKLPKTSIVIIFHNEAWSTLTRSIWSVINRSPKELLKEIILVDDKSTFDYLSNQLDEYVKTLPVSVKVLRMEDRFGIVRARLLGAEHAAGEVITFLDSHIECTEGWLEPLLSRVAANRRIVAVPMIDSILDNTFEYVAAGGKQIGGFDWQLFYTWVPIPKKEKDRIGNNTVAPLYSPTMAGGLFSIDKDFFYDIGSYDEGMLIWGSENIEMSFRVWMCGGIIELIPCSRVGHVYRKQSPYTYPDDKKSYTQMSNKRRVVDVWLDDDWKSFYYSLNPGRDTSAEVDVGSRIALKKKLNCKNFQWYVDNIYPEIDLRNNSKFIGQIQSVDSQNCLVANRDKSEVILHRCNKSAANQIFMLTKENEVRNFKLCLDAPSENGTIKTFRCHQLGGNQKWEYDEEKMTFRHSSGSCLQSAGSNQHYPYRRPCDGSKQQQWIVIGLDPDLTI